ncbi:endonuclease/exonuclease/phosphatase family protein [Qipengyuania sp.]|uniref:endonuclease/exonuclease/phosphatase family protein n=1 Tax=Qipengyuania sp. TaxID=2004515 RepID=UPI0035123358
MNVKVFSKALSAAAAILFLAVVLSLLPSDKWFIRTVDLVREPLTYLAGLLLIAALFARFAARWWTVAALVSVIVINLWRMWPYNPVAQTQVALTDESPAAERCFTALSVNVKVKNEGYGRIVEQIRRYDPDVLFLMETDQRWINELEPVLAAYPHSDRHPQPKAFGLAFASRLEVVKSSIVENTHRDTPTLYATLRMRGGSAVEFIGLHPKPPLPGWNTELRDENIVNAGIETPDRLADAFVMGDFNDVPWSRTTTKFREQGGWRDPRIGRGAFPTFPSDWLFVGWPLDQLMLKGRLELVAFEILPDNGSDHRPVWAKLCTEPGQLASRKKI